MSDKKDTLTALKEVFSSLPRRLKTDATNEFQKYSYNSIQQVKEIIGKELVKHEILFIPNIVEVENQVVGDKVLTTIKMFADFIGPNTEKITVRTFGQATDNQGKGLAKAKSDAIKRLFTDMFLIAAGDEDDEKDYGSAPVRTNKNAEKKIKNPDGSVTSNQINMIWGTAKRKGLNRDAVHSYMEVKFGKNSVKELTKGEASSLIDDLLNHGEEIKEVLDGRASE